MLLLATSLLITDPLPLDMPRAEGYLVREKGVYRLEDRFNKLDLWVSQSVDGRWMDEDGRVFTLSHLDTVPPVGEAARSVATRTDYAAGRVKIDWRDKAAVREALATLSPVAVPEKETRPHQLPRGFKDVDYWQGSNQTAIVCAYLPEKGRVWHLATWELVEGDDFDECRKAFEQELFDREGAVACVGGRTRDEGRETRGDAASLSCEKKGEREFLRADARHAVAAYENWHVTDAAEFSIIDDLLSRDFITTLTNDLTAMRRAYAATLPTPIDGTNVLAVARLYADRSEYLEALEASGLTNMMWSAAYWSPTRRELVAYKGDTYKGDAAFLPREIESSSGSLLSTFRHEAFHQYLSYAASLIPVSPWLNEGYAQYFQNGELRIENGEWKAGDQTWWMPLGAKPSPDEIEQLSLMLKPLLFLDYEAFYAGSDSERMLKYALAHSIAIFLEQGAPAVRFQPFKDVKKDYMTVLFETKSMHQATAAAFKNDDTRKKFVDAWTKFWKEK